MFNAIICRLRKKCKRFLLFFSFFFQTASLLTIAKVCGREDPLSVTMLNINLGKNRELMEKCKTLREYCMFVECIRNDILADFLSAQRAEVITMSIFDYNEEEEMKKIHADEYSAGRETGKAEGKREGRLEAKTIREFMEQTGLTGIT